MIMQIQSIHTRCLTLLDEMKKLEEEGKLLVIEPKDCFGVDTLTRDREQMKKLYDEGYEDAKAALESGFFDEVLEGTKQ